MRPAIVITLICLLASAPTAAIGERDPTDCIDMKGFTNNLRLVNRCSYTVNAIACCYGQGALGSCQASNFKFVTIAAGNSARISSCDNEVGYAACKAPDVFDVSVGRCVDE